ncbi:MAG: hypothetical protein HQL41_02605 [Alphaproteobacteria bacterium]|nr:hypothetical protein [Alphaproteobacteria bacterium]
MINRRSVVAAFLLGMGMLSGSEAHSQSIGEAVSGTVREIAKAGGAALGEGAASALSSLAGNMNIQRIDAGSGVDAKNDGGQYQALQLAITGDGGRNIQVIDAQSLSLSQNGPGLQVGQHAVSGSAGMNYQSISTVGGINLQQFGGGGAQILQMGVAGAAR